MRCTGISPGISARRRRCCSWTSPITTSRRVAGELGRSVVFACSTSPPRSHRQPPAAVCGLPDLGVIRGEKSHGRRVGHGGGGARGGGASSSLRLFDASDNAFDGAPPPVPQLAPSLFIWDVSRNFTREAFETRRWRTFACYASGMRDVTGPIPDAARSRMLRASISRDAG